MFLNFGVFQADDEPALAGLKKTVAEPDTSVSESHDIVKKPVDRFRVFLRGPQRAV
jgi:hypothetical protein